jgi:tRNA1(Val) A37 N6-methylase TrmN6
MTAGWGGRLVGACALNVPRYIGIDNNESLKEPYERMMEFLKPRTKTNMEFMIADALDVDYSTYTYDMVFTSPPYYDLEIYGGTNNRYTTKENWDTYFYKPLFEKTFRHLQPNGHYCLNVSPEIYERACVPVLGASTHAYPLKKSDRRQTRGKKYREYVYVWKK